MAHFTQSKICVALCAAFWTAFAPDHAKANDDLVVYIECKTGDGQMSQGSGVLVSEKGHVLTARHVVPKESECTASVGNNSFQKRGIRKSFASRKISADFDAVLMEFGRGSGEVFEHASICPVTDALKEREIIAKGFHAESFGAPSSTNGILSNTAINFSGIVETSAMTINGKSGGPIFLKGTNQIVGIVAGAQFNSLGAVSYYGMLASDAVLGSLDMLKSGECGGEVSDAATPVAAAAVIETPEITAQTQSGPDMRAPDAQAAFNKGRDRFEQGSYTLAIESFTKAIELDPNNAEAYYWLGESQWFIEQNQKAMESYTSAIEKNNSYVEAYEARALLHFEMRRYQQSIEDFDKVIDLEPDGAWGYFERGKVHDFLRQYQRAYDNYAEAVRLEPGSEDSTEAAEALRVLCGGKFDCSAGWEKILPN